MTDLVADIGGTNSRFALAHAGQLLAGSLWQVPNRQFATFDAALASYLEGRAAPARACIAAAGVVQHDTVALTNHDWQIRAAKLPIAEVHLLNDMQALGYALGPLGAPHTRKLVLNIGTGLNVAVLYSVNAAAYVPPSESGHRRLPHLPDRADAEILTRCSEAYGANALESVLSGAGLERLHVALTGEARTARSLSADWPPETLALALRLLGHCLADLALTHLPEGGIWLAGSVGRALAAQLAHPEFAESYTAKGTYLDLVKSFTISVLKDEVAALTGAAAYLQGQAASD